MHYLSFIPKGQSRLSRSTETLKDVYRIIAKRHTHLSTSYVSTYIPTPVAEQGETLIASTIPLRSEYYINGKICAVIAKLSNSLGIIRQEDILEWENIISLPIPVRFGQIDLMPIIGKFPYRISHEEFLELCSTHTKNNKVNIRGEFRFYDDRGLLIYTKTGTLPIQDSSSDTSRTSCEQAIQFLLNAQIDTGKFKGLIYGAWDYDNQTYRLPSWLWTSSISAHALVQFGYTQTAQTICDQLLDMQVNEGDHKGAWPVRWDVMRDSPTGITTWYAPNDIAYLASHGVLSVYHKTGDSRYLISAINAAKWIIKYGIKPNGQVLHGYRNDKNTWVSNSLYVDAGFTTELFAGLFKITNDPLYKHVVENFIHWYLSNFQQLDGTFLKVWKKGGNHTKVLFARGHAWALSGILAAREISDTSELQNALMMLLQAILKYQTESGGWYYQFDVPKSGECAKTTACLAYYLSKALQSEAVPQEFKPKLIIAVNNAVEWCASHQSQDQSSFGYGGIHSWTSEGAITGTKAVDTGFSYAAAFYLMTVKEIEQF